MTRPPSPLTMLLSRHTKRREFITLLGGAAAVAARGARAAAGEAADHRIPGRGHALRRRANGPPLLCSGCVNSAGSRVARSRSNIAGREGRSERFAEIAAEFVRLKVDVIVTQATAPVVAAKQATSVIPIVFAVAGDPVGTGLVASLARPGGNVTGLSMPGDRSCRQAPRTFARGCPRSPPVGDLGRYRQSRHRAGDGRAPDSGPHARPRSRHTRNSASRGYRARLRDAHGPCRSTLCRRRPAHDRQPGSHQHLGARRATADDLHSGSTSKRAV